jgi:hypothetical protein
MPSLIAAGREHLDPSERLGEVIFGLILVLTFALGAGYAVRESEGAARELLVATLGCNVAWGIIDGVMILMNRLFELFERGRRARLARAVRRAGSEAEALAVIGRELDPPLAAVTTAAERADLYRAVYAGVGRLARGESEPRKTASTSGAPATAARPAKRRAAPSRSSVQTTWSVAARTTARPSRVEASLVSRSDGTASAARSCGGASYSPAAALPPWDMTKNRKKIG